MPSVDTESAFEAAAELFGQNHPEEAETLLKAVLRDEPDHAAALDLLSLILVRTGRPRNALAVIQRLLARDPNASRAHLRMGETLAALGRPQEALFRFTKATALDPLQPEPHAAAASVLAALGRADEAIALFGKALALDPGNVPAHLGLGFLLASDGQHEEAIVHFQAVLACGTANADALQGLGASLFALFRANEALDAYQQLRVAHPKSVLGHLGAGNALQALGRLDEARAAYEDALTLAPDIPTLHRAVAEIKKFREGDPQLQAMEEMALRADRFPVGERISLHFALAKACDDIGRYDQAFENLQRGNALKRRTVHYDEAAVLGYLKDTQTTFSAELMAAKAGQGDPSEVPIFVVGMPRSGTTLVEQLLASHPVVFGAGEQRYLLDLIETGEAGPDYPKAIGPLANEVLRRLGRRYLDRLPTTAERVTDKLPANFRNIGLIHLILPNARVIHVRRDSMDTCFSCYSRLFVNGLEYTNDLGELGRYYRAYETLMDHWRRALPEGVMLEVQYEQLVADFEPQARRILEYSGLQWDERCLKFHETARPIYTVSVQQVRRPLFNTSVGRWRPYRKHLRPLMEALGVIEDA